MFGFFRKRRVYLDHSSATPILPEVLRAMGRAEESFANPGGIHKEGVEAKKTLEAARDAVALELGCKSRQIIFTSGLTESNNLAILGHARKLEAAGRKIDSTHWIVSSIEHDSVLECFSEIEKMGGSVTFIDPDADGRFSADILSRAIRPETVFVSIGWANNEIGVLQPLSDLARVVHGKRAGQTILFHSDAGQAPLYLSPQVHTLGVDLLSLGGGKLYGPRSCGVLYVEAPDSLLPILFGGSQEKGLRAGTENVVPAAGIAKALELISIDRKNESTRLKELRDLLVKELEKAIPKLLVNGNLKHTLPHMLNISIPDISSEYITLALDHDGIAISTKSACRSAEGSSHVVAALGGEEWRARNTLRFSLGKDTTKSDILRTSEVLVSSITKYRQLSG